MRVDFFSLQNLGSGEKQKFGGIKDTLGLGGREKFFYEIH
jgi:hypothetical protein